MRCWQCIVMLTFTPCPPLAMLYDSQDTGERHMEYAKRVRQRLNRSSAMMQMVLRASSG